MPLRPGTQEYRDYQRAWRAANHEKEKARWKKYREANPEKTRASLKKYQASNRATLNAKRKNSREKNIETERARERAWYYRHREKALANRKVWYLANPEKVKARRVACSEKQKVCVKAWRAANPDRFRQQSRKDSSKRRAVVVGATIGDVGAIAKWESEWRRLKLATCHWCNSKFPPQACQSDHIVPISKGGAHSLENLVVACATCNQRKHAKLPHEWRAHLAAPPLL